MEDGRVRDGKPDYFRGGRGKRVHAPRDSGSRGGRDGGFGRGGGTAEKGRKFQLDVCPQHPRFTQDSVGNKFKPPFECFYIDIAVQEIRQKLLSPAQMPQLNVVKHKGILWSLDNRRLWVFRKAEVEEITVNLVPMNFSPRSSEFFSSLNAEIEKIYSNSLYYPRVRGKLGNISHLDRFNDLRIPDAGAILPSLPTRSPEQKARPKPPDRFSSSEITEANNSSPFPKPSPEPKVIPSLQVVPNPKPAVNDHQHQHHHIIEISNNDSNVPLLSSEKEVVSGNVVITFMKKVFHALRFGTMKLCAFWYHKGLQAPYKLLQRKFRGR